MARCRRKTSLRPDARTPKCHLCPLATSPPDR
ncbi:MAG: hypothetical protein ACK5PT_01185 [Cereibacter sp.]